MVGNIKLIAKEANVDALNRPIEASFASFEEIFECSYEYAKNGYRVAGEDGTFTDVSFIVNVPDAKIAKDCNTYELYDESNTLISKGKFIAKPVFYESFQVLKIYI